jgi:hypothetical protein
MERMVVTNTIPQDEKLKLTNKVDVVDVSPVLAETIRRSHFGESVSCVLSLFSFRRSKELGRGLLTRASRHTLVASGICSTKSRILTPAHRCLFCFVRSFRLFFFSRPQYSINLFSFPVHLAVI